MVAVMLMGVAAIVLLCVAAYTLATYALPFMLGLAAARFAYHTGSGLIGAGFVGLLAGAVAFGLLVFLVRDATASDPPPGCGADLRHPGRDCRLCLDPRHHPRCRAVRNLATNLLHHRRLGRGCLCAHEAGRSGDRAHRAGRPLNQ